MNFSICETKIFLQHTGWAKNRTYLSVDNLATDSGGKTCNMSNVWKCCIEKA